MMIETSAWSAAPYEMNENELSVENGTFHVYKGLSADLIYLITSFRELKNWIIEKNLGTHKIYTQFLFQFM